MTQCCGMSIARTFNKFNKPLHSNAIVNKSPVFIADHYRDLPYVMAGGIFTNFGLYIDPIVFFFFIETYWAT